MKKIELYDLSKLRTITDEEAVKFFDLEDKTQLTYRNIWDKASLYKYRKMRDAETSQKLAQNIKAAWRNLTDCDAPLKYVKKNEPFEPIKINTINWTEKEYTEVLDTCLYYLEHGDLTDKQRTLLQKTLVASSKNYKHTYFFSYLLVLMATAMSMIVFIMTKQDPEFVINLVEVWAAAGILTSLGTLVKNLMPTIYLNALNRTAKEK